MDQNVKRTQMNKRDPRMQSLEVRSDLGRFFADAGAARIDRATREAAMQSDRSFALNLEPGIPAGDRSPDFASQARQAAENQDFTSPMQVPGPDQDMPGLKPNASTPGAGPTEPSAAPSGFFGGLPVDFLEQFSQWAELATAFINELNNDREARATARRDQERAHEAEHRLEYFATEAWKTALAGGGVWVGRAEEDWASVSKLVAMRSLALAVDFCKALDELKLSPAAPTPPPPIEKGKPE
jgi:hypothetical protein